MSREIKFRAWNVVTKTMIDLKKVTPLALNMDTDGLFLPFSDGMPLMQFTGLRDKKAKPIHEGDIVHVTYAGGPLKNFTGEVRFDNCEYIVIHKHDWMPLNQHGTLEIIGNIYENPELLKP